MKLLRLLIKPLMNQKGQWEIPAAIVGSSILGGIFGSSSGGTTTSTQQYQAPSYLKGLEPRIEQFINKYYGFDSNLAANQVAGMIDNQWNLAALKPEIEKAMQGQAVSPEVQAFMDKYGIKAQDYSEGGVNPYMVSLGLGGTKMPSDDTLNTYIAQENLTRSLTGQNIPSTTGQTKSYADMLKENLLGQKAATGEYVDASGQIGKNQIGSLQSAQGGYQNVLNRLMPKVSTPTIGFGSSTQPGSPKTSWVPGTTLRSAAAEEGLAKNRYTSQSDLANQLANILGGQESKKLAYGTTYAPGFEDLAATDAEQKFLQSYLSALTGTGTTATTGEYPGTNTYANLLNTLNTAARVYGAYNPYSESSTTDNLYNVSSSEGGFAGYFDPLTGLPL